MDAKELTNRLIKSMAEEPDSWILFRCEDDNRAYLRHNSEVDVRVEGSYYADINNHPTLKKQGVQLKLGWWNHRLLRTAADALVREKTMRAIDRNELLSG